jgi:hypothetical protein
MEDRLIHIQNKIYEVRGQKVMFDFDLAEMYQVETKNLKRAVRRNFDRFPADFMFELTENEWEILRCQIGTSSDNQHGGIRYLPFAFTEQGVAQLSSVLNSRFAIEVNITIIRAFVVLRQYALGYDELNSKLEAFMRETNMQFNEVYQALSELAAQKRLPDRPRRKIGYFTEEQREKGEDIIV